MKTVEFDFVSFIINGFYLSKYPLATKFADLNICFDKQIDNVKYPSSLSHLFEEQYRYFVESVKNSLLQVFSKVKLTSTKNKIWDGVDTPSCQWHNDHLEGGTLFVLLYLDNMKNDGRIWFRQHNQDETAISFLPQCGDLFFISNQPQFQHKAERSTQQRRIICSTFDCEL